MEKSCRKNVKKLQKVAKKSNGKNVYFCDECDYTTSRKSSLDKHLETKKHKWTMIQKLLDNEQFEKSQQIKEGWHYCCWCDYITSKKSDLVKHRKTTKCRREMRDKCVRFVAGEKITIDINEYNKLKKKAEEKVVEESKPHTVIHNITNNINDKTKLFCNDEIIENLFILITKGKQTLIEKDDQWIIVITQIERYANKKFNGLTKKTSFKCYDILDEIEDDDEDDSECSSDED